MDSTANKFKIAPTAGTVLNLARDVYADGASRIYFDNIDHSEGEELTKATLAGYEKVGIVVELRKRCVRELLSRFALRTPQFQVCIPGAGLDPVSLYLLERYEERISRIFEIDRAFMDEKRNMYDRLPLDTTKVHFSTADVTDIESWQQAIRLLGHDPEQPTVVLMEGLIYYLSREKFTAILEALRTPRHNNYIILEYGVPYEAIPEGDRDGCRNVVRAIERSTGWPVQLYQRGDLASLAAFVGAEGHTVHSMQEIELEVKGHNSAFTRQGEGMVEIADFYL